LAADRWVLIGNGSLLAGCGDVLLSQGHRIVAVVTGEREIERWASERQVRAFPARTKLPELLQELEFDHLASIAHLSVVPAEALRLVPGLAVNFHDGPLPELAGLNVPNWAILRGETIHGVTWHVMAERLDAGRILEERRFDIAADETAFLLNAKCYAAGLESFGDLVRRVSAGDTSGREQDLTGRNYFSRTARPAAAATIDPQSSAEEISSLVRALDFGQHANPMCVPKLFLGDAFLAVGQLTIADDASGLEPGTIVAIEPDTVRVATRTNDVVLQKVAQLDGTALSDGLAQRSGLIPGRRLPALTPSSIERLTDVQTRAAKSDDAWRATLATLGYPDIDVPSSASGSEPSRELDRDVLTRFSDTERVDSVLAAIALLAARRSGEYTFDVSYADANLTSNVEGTFGAFEAAVPLRVEIDRRGSFSAAVGAVAAARGTLDRRGPLAADLWVRHPELTNGRSREATVSIGLGVEPPPGRVRFAVAADGSNCRVIAANDDLAAQLTSIIKNALVSPARPVAEIDLLTSTDLEKLLLTWNDTARPVPDSCVHQQFADQVQRTPEAPALVFRGRKMTYRELDERTNRLARHLQSLGVGPDVLVGVFLQRSFAMVEAVLATLKAGGAYVPLDPTYPADRIEFMVADAKLGIVLTESDLKARVPAGPAHVVDLEASEAALAQISSAPLENSANPLNLAYVIYTSGSTGRPKGVMIEHRNVSNFAVGMDETIDAKGERNTWLAVTSLSFDISVLELLWTLARGFAVVIFRDEERESFIAKSVQRRPVDFSLFYFSSDESEYAQNKYRLLMDGARFADKHGFVAVWTPERHFHAFGGLFPNPSITSAAVAAVTENIGIRAGSVVSPLHSSLRIAEEWSVVDNLSNGRVAISFAPGWQPNDFVLKPDAFQKRKDIMFEQIEEVKKLWRGESVPYVNGTGQTVETRILPRPVQKELPVWVTIAGNPESFVAAAKAGANVLTHLLGQTVKEVGEKVALYRRTWREAGHAGSGTVTMMLHTFIGTSDDEVKHLVRRPMKEYLRSAVGLVREAAWSFPTFKKKATNEKGEFDPDQLTAEEMDALLEHAFERYYSTSGLFGTVETGCAFVDSLRDIGIDEVACLIDFGVPTEAVLAHLPHLADVVRTFKSEREQSAAAVPAVEAETIPSLITSQAVTHFQCTPTMAQIVLHDVAARPALRRLRQMLVGGEAVPEQLARELASSVGGIVTNVYGPTETTVWSSTSRIDHDSDVTIGFPIANTSLHVLDKDGRLAPVGLAGELHIGGQGVVRGYWNRPELTDERFVQNPFGAGRLYRTGDLVRRRPDGALDFLGRLDHQVKIRGHRIELGEIEARLSEHPEVQEAVVVARDDGSGPALVAYVIARGTLDEGDVRKHLRARVPEYMMPRAFVKLTAFPMTPNRKIDRKALPAPQRTAVVVPISAPAEGTLEQTIATVWCEVLELPSVGVETNFADVGGHSLAMVQVLGRLKEQVSPTITLVDLFRYTTIRSLAKFLSNVEKPHAALTASATRAASRRAALAGRKR
jgi:natural product biosynthesis luciferase-like monooxygenase protein